MAFEFFLSASVTDPDFILRSKKNGGIELQICRGHPKSRTAEYSISSKHSPWGWAMGAGAENWFDPSGGAGGDWGRCRATLKSELALVGIFSF